VMSKTMKNARTKQCRGHYLGLCVLTQHHTGAGQHARAMSSTVSHQPVSQTKRARKLVWMMMISAVRRLVAASRPPLADKSLLVSTEEVPAPPNPRLGVGGDHENTPKDIPIDQLPPFPHRTSIRCRGLNETHHQSPRYGAKEVSRRIGNDNTRHLAISHRRVPTHSEYQITMPRRKASQRGNQFHHHT